MTGVPPPGFTVNTASAGFHIGISPETQTVLVTGSASNLRWHQAPLASDSAWSQTALPYANAVCQRWQQAALAMAST